VRMVLEGRTDPFQVEKYKLGLSHATKQQAVRR